MNDKDTNDSIEGKYANNFRVGHNAFEFLIEFCQEYEDKESNLSHTRIITSPSYIKDLLNLLNDSIAHYEKTFGKIGSYNS